MKVTLDNICTHLLKERVRWVAAEGAPTLTIIRKLKGTEDFKIVEIPLEELYRIAGLTDIVAVLFSERVGL